MIQSIGLLRSMKTNELKLSYEEYEKLVISKAIRQHKKPVCTDSIQESYDEGKPIDIAVKLVIIDSVFWEM